MITLSDKRSGQTIGSISEAQLQFLVSQMEEETPVDQDYAITSMTLDYFTTLGADPNLMQMLREALGNREEMIIQWSSPELGPEDVLDD
jgi:processive 1,2-diacylglycerol beta-glucosyltransferase